MNYLFSNRKVKIGDICVVSCLKEHLKMMHLDKVFSQKYKECNSSCILGVKIIWTSSTRSKGILMFKNKEGKVFPYKVNDKEIKIILNTGNHIGLIEYQK